MVLTQIMVCIALLESATRMIGDETGRALSSTLLRVFGHLNDENVSNIIEATTEYEIFFHLQTRRVAPTSTQWVPLSSADPRPSSPARTFFLPLRVTLSMFI
jgi:hypothetical protein